MRKRFSDFVLLAFCAGASLSITLAAAAPVPGVSLKVSSESAPPGRMVQIKVIVTEPKPISTGKGRLSVGDLTVAGIALRSPADDAYGVAVVDPTGLDLSVVSPASTLGTELDYPVLTVTGRVPATAPIGVVIPVDLEVGSLELLDPAGVPYPWEVSPGEVLAAPGVSVDDVLPGSADLPAGAVVTIRGGGFLPGVRVRFKETKLAAVQYVSPRELRVVLGQPARMHGMMIRVVNPDHTKATYFSYQRTTRVEPSTNPVLASAVPLFPLRFATTALVTAGAGTTGLALQNITTKPAVALADLFSPEGNVVRTVSLALPPNRYMVREIGEVFGVTSLPGSSVRVRSVVPLQVMGIAVDAGGARPIVPR